MSKKRVVAYTMLALGLLFALLWAWAGRPMGVLDIDGVEYELDLQFQVVRAEIEELELEEIISSGNYK